MACGSCNQNKTFTQSNPTGVTQTNSVSPVAQRAAAAPIEQAKHEVPDTSCHQMYDQLAALERKTVNLYNKFRLEVGGKAVQYLEKQRMIRKWIMNLKNECPDEAAYRAVANEIGTDFKNLF